MCCLLWFGSNTRYLNSGRIAIPFGQSYQKLIIFSKDLSLFSATQNLNVLHGEGGTIAVLVIVRLMSPSYFLLHDPCPELPVDLDAAMDRRRRCLVLEYPAHVVEEAGGSQHDRWRLQVIPAVQEELSVVIALGGGWVNQ